MKLPPHNDYGGYICERERVKLLLLLLLLPALLAFTKLEMNIMQMSMKHSIINGGIYKHECLDCKQKYNNTLMKYIYIIVILNEYKKIRVLSFSEESIREITNLINAY